MLTKTTATTKSAFANPEYMSFEDLKSSLKQVTTPQNNQKIHQQHQFSSLNRVTLSQQRRDEFQRHSPPLLPSSQPSSISKSATSHRLAKTVTTAAANHVMYRIYPQAPCKPPPPPPRHAPNIEHLRRLRRVTLKSTKVTTSNPTVLYQNVPPLRNFVLGGAEPSSEYSISDGLMPLETAESSGSSSNATVIVRASPTPKRHSRRFSGRESYDEDEQCMTLSDAEEEDHLESALISPPTPLTPLTAGAYRTVDRTLTPTSTSANIEQQTARIMITRRSNLQTRVPIQTSSNTINNITPTNRRINSLSPIMTSSRTDLKPIQPIPTSTQSLQRYSIPVKHYPTPNRAKFANVSYFCQQQQTTNAAINEEQLAETSEIQDNSLCSLVLLPPSPFKSTSVEEEEAASKESPSIRPQQQEQQFQISSNRHTIMVSNSSERKPTIKRVSFMLNDRSSNNEENTINNNISTSSESSSSGTGGGSGSSSSSYSSMISPSASISSLSPSKHGLRASPTPKSTATTTLDSIQDKIFSKIFSNEDYFLNKCESSSACSIPSTCSSSSSSSSGYKSSNLSTSVTSPIKFNQSIELNQFIETNRERLERLKEKRAHLMVTTTRSVSPKTDDDFGVFEALVEEEENAVDMDDSGGHFAISSSSSSAKSSGSSLDTLIVHHNINSNCAHSRQMSTLMTNEECLSSSRALNRFKSPFFSTSTSSQTQTQTTTITTTNL